MAMKLYPNIEIASVRGGYMLKTTLPDGEETYHAAGEIETVLEIVKRNLVAYEASDRASEAIPKKLAGK